MACLKILVTSQKGGVGKSTVAANLAAYFAKVLGKSTTLLDFDPHGSSSSWLNRAAPSGVTVQHHPLPIAMGEKRALVDARMHLRRAVESSEVVVTDLTWSEAIEGELLFEFDLVLTPVSMSAIEISATVTFLSRFRWVFDSVVRMPPTLLICPSRVTETQMSEDLFSQQRFPISFMLTPPVTASEEARQLFEEGYLFEVDGYTGMGFASFANAVNEAGGLHADRAQNHKPSISDVRKISGGSRVLNRFLMQNAKKDYDQEKARLNLVVPKGLAKRGTD
jgi:hypothetical protein